MACGENVVVVGSYNECDDFGSLQGVRVGYDTHYYPGEISDFSSYGTLLDGRNLPHVCAPGASLISSTNHYYLTNSDNNMSEGYLQAKAVGTDRNYYWEVAAGTSMSCPFVAGTIATWLEADPTLTYSDVIDIITSTAKVDSYVTDANVDPVQWGAGKFDGYAGLKEVLRRSDQEGVNDVKIGNDKPLMITQSGSELNVFLAGETSLSYALYNLAGQAALTGSVSGDEAHINTSALAKGVYVLAVNGKHAQRVIVK
jgi:subtilisin family serine protease